MNKVLKEIGVKNFKSFKDLSEIELAPITIFVGPNNSGKSSILQSIKILKDSLSSDGREKIDLISFLRTKINTKTLRERYGNIGHFVNDSSEDKRITFSFKIEDPLILKTINITVEIEVKTEDEGNISSMKVTDSSGQLEYFSFFVENENLDYGFNNDYSFAPQISLKVSQLNLITEYENTIQYYVKWFNNIIDVGFRIEKIIITKTKLIIDNLADELLKIYSKEKIEEYAKYYIDVLETYITLDKEIKEKGISFLNKFLTKNCLQNINDFDEIENYEKRIFNSLWSSNYFIDLNDIFQEIFFYSILIEGNLEYRVNLSSSIDKDFRKISDFESKVLKNEIHNKNTSNLRFFEEKLNDEISLIENELRNQLLNSIPYYLEKYFVFNFLDIENIQLISEDILEFSIFECIASLQIKQINSENYFLLTNLINDAIGSKEYLKENDKINITSLLYNDDELFVKKVEETLHEYLDLTEISIEFNQDKIREIEENILKKISQFEIQFGYNDNLNFPKISNFFPNFIYWKLDNLSLIKQIHFTIRIFLSFDFDYCAHILPDALKKIDILKKIRINNDNYKIEDNLIFFIRLSIFYFLHESNLTRLLVEEDFEIKNDTSGIDLLSIFRKDLKSNINDHIYTEILNTIDIVNLNEYYKNFHNQPLSEFYSACIQKFEKRLSHLHNDIRNILVNYIHHIPAIKNSMKRNVSLHNDFNETSIQIMNLDNKLRSFQRYSYDNKYLTCIGQQNRLIIEKNNEYGFASIHILKEDDKKINIVDQGHGLAQLTMLCHLLYVASDYDETSTKLFLIEEPEISLHPSLQSKLADIFKISVKDDNIQIVAETHSEYLVRKLQYLTAKGDLQKGDVAIYYFSTNDNNSDNSIEKLYKIEINEDGTLTRNFGKGFYDESNNIALDLLFTTFDKNN